MTRSLVRLTRVGVLVGSLAAVFALTASHAQAGVVSPNFAMRGIGLGSTQTVNPAGGGMMGGMNGGGMPGDGHGPGHGYGYGYGYGTGAPAPPVYTGPKRQSAAGDQGGGGTGGFAPGGGSGPTVKKKPNLQ
jgi:hypothetical protein